MVPRGARTTQGTSRDEYGRLVLGDIIRTVNGTMIKSSSDLYKVLDKSKVRVCCFASHVAAAPMRHAGARCCSEAHSRGGRTARGECAYALAPPARHDSSVLTVAGAHLACCACCARCAGGRHAGRRGAAGQLGAARAGDARAQRHVRKRRRARHLGPSPSGRVRTASWSVTKWSKEQRGTEGPPAWRWPCLPFPRVAAARGLAHGGDLTVRTRC